MAAVLDAVVGIAPGGQVRVLEVASISANRQALAQGQAWRAVAGDIPRDGGMADLLAEAASPAPKFAAVICEDIERSGRDTFNALKLEKKLSRQGIPLFATDEPAVDAAAAADRDATAAAIQARLKQIDTAQNSCILELEQLPADPADTAAAALRSRIRARSPTFTPARAARHPAGRPSRRPPAPPTPPCSTSSPSRETSCPASRRS